MESIGLSRCLPLTQPEQITALMHGMAVLIGLTDFKLHRVVTEKAQRRSYRFGHERCLHCRGIARCLPFDSRLGFVRDTRLTILANREFWASDGENLHYLSTPGHFRATVNTLDEARTFCSKPVIGPFRFSQPRANRHRADRRP